MGHGNAPALAAPVAPIGVEQLVEAHLAEQIVGFVQALRKEELEKKPGIAEMLDWAAALAGLGVNDLADDPVQTQATLVCLLKTERDRAAVPREVQQRLAGKAA